VLWRWSDVVHNIEKELNIKCLAFGFASVHTFWLWFLYLMMLALL